MKDPFVSEVIKYRELHSKQFNFDIHAICEDLRNYQNILYEVSSIDGEKKFANKNMDKIKLRRFAM